ncbi:MAG: hypothetical protein QF440_00850 [Candidatus Thalassarchaeaceae archaeon]|jgi:predicted ATP-dependent serine protease|nr:hypothetical protein [Candidatus Thalassarchaeaceae archaeon]
MPQLPTVNGCIHLSVEAGCGGTTFALQIARDKLANGEHVVWVCNEIPDGLRMSQIYADVSPVAVSKLHMAAVGDNVIQGISSAQRLIPVLQSLGLIVVDDWAPKSGRVSTEVSANIRELIENASVKNTPLLLISAAYEDASGETGWKARGDIDVSTWFLHKSQDGISKRELFHGDSISIYDLLEEGFILRK